MKTGNLNLCDMKNVKILFVLITLLVTVFISSCQKDMLPNAQTATNGKTLKISTDSSKLTLTLSTDSTPSMVKSKSISVDWLKTFSPVAGDNDYFILQANTSWQIISNPSWVTVSPLTGTGNAHVTVTLAANNGPQRTGAITISGSGVTNPVTISVLQLAGTTVKDSISVDWLKVFSANAGDNDFFKVISNTTWKIVSYPSWLIVSPQSGTGNSHVTVTVQANNSAQRTGNIVLSGTGVNQNVSVSALQVAGIVAAAVVTQQADYYVAPTGSDSNPGTISQPFYSMSKLVSVMKPGQLAFMRGGRYNYNSQSMIDLTGLSGAAGNYINIFNYPGEVPTICPGSSYPNSNYNYGVNMYNNNYIHLKGLEITGFIQDTKGDNCMGLWIWGNSNYNIFELLNYHGNGFPCVLQPSVPNTAPGIGNGNQFINCDFYRNYDPNTSAADGTYGNADGLNIETNKNTSTTVTGCRVWNNSDDGIDAYRSNGMIIVTNCWVWNQGYREMALLQEVTVMVLRLDRQISMEAALPLY